MSRRSLYKIVSLLFAAALVVGCGEDSLDGEAKTAFDVGHNNDNGGGGGSNNDFVPEEEEDFEFSAPAVIGERVYVANETLNSVAVIDSRNLSISTRLVGFRPTQIAGPDAERVEPADDAKVMVLNEGSRSVSILDTDDDGVENVGVMARANAMQMDPTGRAAVVWYDPERAKSSDPAGDLSSVTVVADGTSHEVSVGFNVRGVYFDDAGTSALVLTDDGISKIDLTTIDGDHIAPPKEVIPPMASHIMPEQLEVLVSSDGQWALTRSSAFNGVALMEIDTGEHHYLELPDIPTDIELIEGDDEREILVMLRNRGQVVRATIPDGFTQAADAMDTSQQTQANSADAGLVDAGDAGTDAGGTLVDGGSDADAGLPDGGTTSDGGTMSDGGLPDGGTPDGGLPDGGTNSDGGTTAPDAHAGDAGSVGDASSGDAGSSDAGDDTPWFPSGITGFEVIDVVVDGLGAASIARDGATALLFSTIGEEKRAVLLDLGDAEQRTLAFEKGVRGALSDRSGQTFLVYHSKVDGPIPPDATPADPVFIERSWGVSVVDIESAASRLVLTKHKPEQATLWAPDQGDAKVYVIFEAPEANNAVEPSHRDVLTINLRSFRTDSFRVPSLPEGLGPIRTAGRVYVSQRHPQGRMTFVEAESDARQTVTGYQLNAGID
jgi:hypothetical protein